MENNKNIEVALIIKEALQVSQIYSLIVKDKRLYA